MILFRVFFHGQKVAANMSKSRNEKFHKLFKNIPEVEHVLKCRYKLE